MLHKLSSQPVKSKHLVFKKEWHLFVFCWGVVVAVGVIYLIAYNPAISSPDTYTQFMQAKGITPVVDWHTPFHTLIIRFLLSIWDSPTFVALIQCMFWGYVVASGVLLLHRISAPQTACIAGTVLFAIIPTNALYSITIWKDIPYGASILWITILFAKLLIFPEASLNSPRDLAQWGISLTFICLLRQNGIIVYILMIFGVLFISRSYKALVCVILSISFVLFFRGPIYTIMDVQDGPVGGKYIALGQDILGVYFTDGTIPPEADRIVEELTSEEDYRYSPYRAWTAYYDLDIPMQDFLKAYILTFVNNPEIMTRAILSRCEIIWSIFQSRDGGVDTANYYGSISLPLWVSFYGERKENQWTSILSIYNDAFKNNQMYVIFWRIGIYTLLTLGNCVLCYIQRKKWFLWILLPWAGQIISLLLSTGWLDYRYFWPLYLISIYFMLLFICHGRYSSDLSSANKLKNRVQGDERCS